ncbi:hypothetical protein SAMN04488033_10894 [Salegentibacter agarivorans]|uniref:Uncharacterized protein n=1 Tax=Salegentibacter agarivorans TaxID=345907 RepID=A0A1I2LJI3_9FLAO|nr:hypothetical protein [Salegentibacter agarivorans]SFF77261.1 hypothetical protein SAMN04488033_10894 [Salegentibacter agarivorans]
MNGKTTFDKKERFLHFDILYSTFSWRPEAKSTFRLNKNNYNGLNLITMKIQLNFKCINEDYSQEFADQFHLGKESENNSKYHWEQSFEVPDVIEVSKPEEPFKLIAELEDGTQLQKEIDNVHILRLKFDDGQKKDCAVSGAILKETNAAYLEKEGTKCFYFYLNEESKALEVLDGVFLTEEDAYGEGFVVV